LTRVRETCDWTSQAGFWKDHPKSRLRRHSGDSTSGILSIGSSIILVLQWHSPSGFCLDNAPFSFLLLLIRRPVTSPLRSGGIYHFFRTHTYSPYRPSVPISLMVPLAFYDKLLRRIRTIYDCTYDAQQTHYLSGCWVYIWKSKTVQRFELPLCSSFSRSSALQK